MRTNANHKPSGQPRMRFEHVPDENVSAVNFQLNGKHPIDNGPMILNRQQGGWTKTEDLAHRIAIELVRLKCDDDEIASRAVKIARQVRIELTGENDGQIQDA